jgi:hypothetical protein
MFVGYLIARWQPFGRSYQADWLIPLDTGRPGPPEARFHRFLVSAAGRDGYFSKRPQLIAVLDMPPIEPGLPPPSSVHTLVQPSDLSCVEYGDQGTVIRRGRFDAAMAAAWVERAAPGAALADRQRVASDIASAVAAGARGDVPATGGPPAAFGVASARLRYSVPPRTAAVSGLAVHVPTALAALWATRRLRLRRRKRRRDVAMRTAAELALTAEAPAKRHGPQDTPTRANPPRYTPIHPETPLPRPAATK